MQLPTATLQGAELEARLHAIQFRVRGKKSEPDSLEAPTPVALVGDDKGESSGLEEGAKKHRTLFFGVPLRSKRGKEILPQVQGIVNKLEASGFPVQRFHADRAKELRTTALIGWMKTQGVHLTWTAGESPAANRAELAVQSLKGFIRKLLIISGLEPVFWPLALLHGSTRNWINFCESVGVPQPPLLPFGMKIHARKRTRTGYKEQWVARTVEGIYLGHAPNTPGGHLVLVSQDEGRKVLLTNTVYPLRDAGPPTRRPKYPLVGKRSPDFVVRVVAARALTDWCCDAGSRCIGAPGGESSLNFGSDFSSTKEVNCDSLRLSEESGSEGEEASGVVELGYGLGVFVDTLDFSFESGELEESGLTLKALSCEDYEWIAGCMDQGLYSDQVCQEVLERFLSSLPKARRPLLKGQGRAVLLGLYGVGGFRGVSKASEAYPEVTRYLNGFVKSKCAGHVWTTLYVSRDTKMPIHRDLRNARGFDTLVSAVGDFSGGGLWVEDEFNCGPVGKVLPHGVRRFGRVFDVRSDYALFSGERWHVAEEWEGGVRWVISAFTPREVSSTTGEQWDSLKGLGFPVEEVKCRIEQQPAVRVGVSTVPRVADEVWDCTRWSVALPLPLVDEQVSEGLESEYQSVARLCRLLAGDLCDTVDATEGVRDLTLQLLAAERSWEWLEQCLIWNSRCQEVAVRALHPEVSLSSEEPPQDQFLQTRTVGLAEARKELFLWKEAAQDEVYSLETTNRAVDRVLVEDVDRWVAEGVNVVQLPGKVVLTRKSGTGKRRCRAVCCGNYLPTEKLGLGKDDLYASGAESLSVKVALTFAAGHPVWTGVTIDVKSAFLYAPIRGESKENDERIVVKPPTFLVELGILGRNDRWWIRKALYGLPTSPRDWGRYRDQEFCKFQLRWNDADYHLVQTLSDDALWLARKVTKMGYGDIEGILVVYVDDLLFLAPKGLGEAFVRAVQERWKTSTPEWLSDKPLTFCGMELSQQGSGYRMCQTAYVRELLGRYGIEESASTPITRWTEPDLGSPPTAEEVKEAQAITGALLWLSTRTRPDLSYVVSRCGQQATKCPCLTVSLGRQALAYLKDTIEVGIDVPFKVGSSFSDHGLLSLPRSEKVLELYSDASHSPQGERSMQSIFILWKGVPLTWEASRQPFVTLSSAEAELVCMVHGVQVAEAVVPLIQELIENDVVISLLGDNEAAIRAFHAAPSSEGSYSAQSSMTLSTGSNPPGIA